MTKLLTIMDTRNMSSTKINIELGKRVKELESLGMDRTSASEFISSVMNLGIAAQEQWNNAKAK